MTDTGLACVFSVEPNVPIEIADFPLPEVEPDAILVRMTIANICGSDLHVWRGEMSAPFETAPPGYGSGHEGTGQVARLGSNINTDSLGRPIQEGDRVVFAYFFPCNRCYACLDDRPNACPTRSSRFGPRTVAQPPYFTGTFAQYYYLRPGHYVFKAPDDLSDELLAPANCALCQVIQSFQEAGLRLGDTVVLQGAGGLGLYGAAVAREMGAGLIISIDRLSSRLEMAKRFGADVVIDASEISNSEDRIAQGHRARGRHRRQHRRRPRRRAGCDSRRAGYASAGWRLRRSRRHMAHHGRYRATEARIWQSSHRSYEPLPSTDPAAGVRVPV